MYKCKYCNKECKTYQSLGGHTVKCNDNPKKDEYIKKANKAKTHERNEYEFECKKCNKIYSVELTENQLKKNQFKKHCSRACANSRTWSDEDKVKKSISSKTSNFVRESRENRWKDYKKKVKKVRASSYIKVKNPKKPGPMRAVRRIVYCKHCNVKFEVYNKSIQKFCSQPCSNDFRRANKSYKKMMSEQMKLQYKNGRKIYGGHDNVKWYEYNGIKVHGTWELRTCKILDKWKRIGKIINWEYESTLHRFQYVNDTGQHTYIPDFAIYNVDGTVSILEIKGLKRDDVDLKTKSTLKAGYQIEIWDDIKTIKRYELE